MKKKYRIKKNNEIINIIKKKKTVGDKYFVIYCSEASTSNFRFAVSVNKKYGTAPERNQIKRQVRAVIQNYNKRLEVKDFFIVIKLRAKELDFKEIESRIYKLLKRANLMKEEISDEN